MFSGLAARQDLILVGLLVLTTVMMILPMPTMFADILIATNIALSVMLMMVAIYINGSVEFSTLPTVILISTAFRLSLSITTSRMILVQGDAGDIIRTFGEFVIAGNIVVGLVVYLIITIVQFVVITKGATRCRASRSASTPTSSRATSTSRKPGAGGSFWRRKASSTARWTGR